jgi:uncharacterized protein YggT (Ycf19 family)
MEPVSITRAVVVAHWYYFLPQYALAVLMWTMAGRFLLGLFAPPDWDNYVWRFFRRLTDPVIAVVRRVTPPLVIEPFMPLVALWWLRAQIAFEVDGAVRPRPALAGAG